jgi:hypothetical protein
MTTLERAILLCAIAASTPRNENGKIGDSTEEHCIYTAKIADALGWGNGVLVKRAIELASYARDVASGSGWIHKRTQETDAEAEAWLREMLPPYKGSRRAARR